MEKEDFFILSDINQLFKLEKINTKDNENNNFIPLIYRTNNFKDYSEFKKNKELHVVLYFGQGR